MRYLTGWIGLVWLASSCTVPSLDEVLAETPRGCTSTRPCAEGYLCVEDACVTHACEGTTPTVGYADVDGDGYGSNDAAYVISCGSLAAGFAARKGDCDEGDSARHPGVAEVCDRKDNNCDLRIDEGVTRNWYPDRDKDSFGDRQASPLPSCTDPSDATTAYLQDNTDCQDSDATIFPRAATSPEARCDEVDEDCDGTVDDGFELKGTACASPCAGQYVCNASRTALTCNAPTPTSYSPDADGDGAGAQGGSTSVCPGGTPPVGSVANSLDCDDEDPYRRGGRVEACDSRDNTCDAQIDEGNVCAGKGWRLSTDVALTGAGRDWRTVAVGPGGLPVWVAGLGGVLAVRTSAGQPFTSRDGACNTRNWQAAWVRPSDGHVFLAGDGGYLAQHTGTNCINTTQTPSVNNLTGIVGFESGATTVLYVVDTFGRLSVWTPGSAPLERYNIVPTYFGIHGLSSTLLLGVGGQEDLSGPSISSYAGTGGATEVTIHTLNGIGGTTGSLRAVWMGAPNLAYAVGDNGLVMKWSGGTSWDRVPAPSGATVANFTSIRVLDAHSIYVTDTDGRIWLRTATRWVDLPLYDADKPLQDIAVTSPTDVWAVGDDGRVLHFAE